MKINRYLKTTLRLLFLLSLSTLLVACAKEEKKLDPMSGGAISGQNYSGEGIQTFSVDGSWGGAIGRYSSGGTVCCVTYPRIWTPELKVTIKWERSDCERQRHLCTLETAMQGKTPYKTFDKTIPIPEYSSDGGTVYVLFFPHDEVRIHITEKGLGEDSFPGNPGNPDDHNPERNK